MFSPKILPIRHLVTPLVLVVLLAAWVAGPLPSAGASAYLPPTGKIFAGVTDDPISAYTAAVDKHPAVYQEFLAWGQYLPGITQDALNAHARMMMAISTAYGTHEAITPEGIADGRGDAWLIGLQGAIAASHNITYVRLMAEMDNANNPYCAYNADGSSRGASHSAREFKLAWKRVTLIMRGGSVSHIDAVLKRLGLPALAAARNSALPSAPVAMLWVPMTSGSPDVAGNQPSDYWPGRAWVDWVGTDFYSKFPNFTGLNAFYRSYGSLPFVFGEYALWGADDPSWVNALFGWTFSHPRVRMMVYNQGAETDGPFRLLRYPQAALALRHQLASPRFPAYAPEWVQ